MIYLSLLFSAAIVAVDQLIKSLALRHLTGVATVPLWEDVLHLTYVENRGMAFSMMEGQTWLLVWVTGAILLALLLYMVFGKGHTKPLLFSMAAVLGGGVGNLIDRATVGFVVDYIDVRIINFAVFNFADICVCLGTIAMMICILLSENKKSKEDKE